MLNEGKEDREGSPPIWYIDKSVQMLREFSFLGQMFLWYQFGVWPVLSSAVHESSFLAFITVDYFLLFCDCFWLGFQLLLLFFLCVIVIVIDDCFVLVLLKFDLCEMGCIILFYILCLIHYIISSHEVYNFKIQPYFPLCLLNVTVNYPSSCYANIYSLYQGFPNGVHGGTAGGLWVD